jgi:outer membrane lipoprotein SlyB
MNKLIIAVLLGLGCGALLMSDALAQRAGDSVSVRTGTVSSVRNVDLNDGNAVGGALVGGAFGAALTRSSKGSSRRDRNAAIGAIMGAAAAGSKTQPGRIYTVSMGDGSMVQVATEQTEIQKDDCVYVEQSGKSANIRRAPATACAAETQSLLSEPEIVAEMNEEASECMAAKQSLIDAESDDAMDRAVRKIQLLCYD